MSSKVAISDGRLSTLYLASPKTPHRVQIPTSVVGQKGQHLPIRDGSAAMPSLDTGS